MSKKYAKMIRWEAKISWHDRHRYSGDDLWSRLSQGIHHDSPTVLWAEELVHAEEMNLETLDFSTLDLNKDGFACSLRPLTTYYDILWRPYYTSRVNKQPSQISTPSRFESTHVSSSSSSHRHLITAVPPPRWTSPLSVERDSHSSISSRAALGFLWWDKFLRDLFMERSFLNVRLGFCSLPLKSLLLEGTRFLGDFWTSGVFSINLSRLGWRVFGTL